MKQTQQGFIGIVLVIVAALAIGGGVYYHQKNKVVINEITSPIVVDDQENIDLNEKPQPLKKPVQLSFEAKARAAAKAGACAKYGTIGAAIRLEAQNEYALFSITSGSNSVGSCAVDMYQRTTVDALIATCKTGDQNCHGSGFIPTPRKVYESIPTAPLPVAN